MAVLHEAMAPIELPKIPVPIKDFVPYFSSHSKTPPSELLEPFKTYEAELRKIYAQQPHHEAVKDGLTNTVPVFTGHQAKLQIRARDLASESPEEKEKYIMPLEESERLPDGAAAVVTSLKEFQNNFNLFSESSLTELDWSNVVAAGSAVTTALLPVPEKWAGSKRSLREYYHEHLAPASDVDLFVYGLNEEEAIEKIKQIETSIKDSILHECTTIRTKNAITIASQYPTRHVQIVLRLYDSISQIITGFDVDCACAAYSGTQVYASPRALVALSTQINDIDLTRRSPSYENRLSKYSHRGFEVHWPLLDRSRIDPTIFERSFRRTNGLARLLVLEKLPKTADRDAYTDQRRAERGRPAANRSNRNQHRLWGNIKEDEEDDVAEWVEEDEVSNYHTMVVPYGKRFNAAKINKLIYTKDLLLNAEWNKPKDREVNLHRHPCFFGTAEDVIADCCGFCPVPRTDEEIEVAEEESKTYISGNLTFIKDDPGRQEIGSFNPITTDDWCEMAFVGNTQMLCQAITDGDVEYVQAWCAQEGNDLQTRDYCGRTPLHLAIIATPPLDSSSEADESRKRSLEIIQCLVDNGARLVARLVDGRTALHLAAAQGDLDIVKSLMTKSLANEEEEAEKDEQRRITKKAEQTKNQDLDSAENNFARSPASETNSDEEIIDIKDGDEDSMTMGSFVKVEPEKSERRENSNEIPEDTDEPDFYDINILAWDFATSPLHLAIVNGHVEMIRLLVQEYGADPLLPIKIISGYYNNNTSAFLSLALTLLLPPGKAKDVAKALLELGATCAQADMNHFTTLHYVVAGNNSEVFETILDHDAPAAQRVLNFVAMGNSNRGNTALTIALKHSHETMVTRLVSLGAKTTISFDDFAKSYISKNEYAKAWAPEHTRDVYNLNCMQPILIAASKEMPRVMETLLSNGADPCTLDAAAHRCIKDPYTARWQQGASVLDIVREKLKALEDFKDFNEKPPMELKGEGFYMSGLKTGGYQHFIAKHLFLQEKEKNLARQQEYQKRLKEAKEAKGVNEKREAISMLIEDFQSIEKRLVAAGAKPFQEMYPDFPLTDSNYFGNRYRASDPEPFKISFSVNVPYLNDRLKEGYAKLFEAVWTNDLEEVKSLTLGAWTSTDNTENQPLQIAVMDKNGFSPFAVAVLRGYLKLARTIVEISLAQYEPEDTSGHRERWTMNAYDSDVDSDSEADELNIFSEIVNDTFTIENVAAISTAVKSRVDPITMIQWRCMAGWLTKDKKLFTELAASEHCNMMEYAVQVDDLSLLKFLLEISAEYATHQVSDNSYRAASVGNLDATLDSAIRLGRTAIIAELIRTTGAGIPFDDLVQKSGIEIKEKPRYYQGLNVGGKKREDWAQAGRAHYGIRVDHSDSKPLLLRAAHFGSIESVQWFLSDAPLRMYVEFASTNKADKRVRTLDQTKEGFEGTIAKWLKTRRELSLHCAILWNPPSENEAEYVSLVKYLLSAMPECLERRSSGGYTPLHLAVVLRRPEIVDILLSAGANQRARDSCSRNVVHNLLVPLVGSEASWQNEKARYNPDVLRGILQLFDEDHVKEMLLERCTLGPELSTLTPLAYWLKRNITDHDMPDVIEILSEYTHGEDLELINGEGDLPLHDAVKKSSSNILSYFISVRPDLLHRENATGRTPLEMATDLYLQERVSRVPTINEDDDSSINSPQLLIHRAVSSFAEDDKSTDIVSSKKRTYEICMEAALQHPSKRRLVSLFEANEVAKRLVGLRSRTQSTQNESEESDEVSSYLGASNVVFSNRFFPRKMLVSKR